MEKQSLIKYYCGLFLVLVLLAGFNGKASAKNTSSLRSIVDKDAIISLAAPVNVTHNSSSVETMLPLILSILALVASGSAISLSILKNKEIKSTKSLIEKYDNKLNLLETKYTELLTSQANFPPNQQRKTISQTFQTSSNPNVYLEASIEDISVRVSNLEDKLQPPRNHQQSIDYKNTYLSKQSSSLTTDINPFSPPINTFQSNITQPLENTYVELVNTYNTNPKLLEQTAIKVSEPTDSINRRHTDSSQKIVLEKANNSNYWVIHDDVGANCWLLPKNKLRIDQFRYETTKALFDCHGYYPDYSTFKLVKPAKVIPLSADEQTWQLEELGILEFSV